MELKRGDLVLYEAYGFAGLAVVINPYVDIPNKKPEDGRLTYEYLEFVPNNSSGRVIGGVVKMVHERVSKHFKQNSFQHTVYWAAYEERIKEILSRD